MAAMLFGCAHPSPEQTNAGIYEMSQARARQLCYEMKNKVQMDECLSQTRVSYEDYRKQRQERLNAPTSSTEVNKPMHCSRASPTDEVTCSNQE
jgi:hypothetical protein